MKTHKWKDIRARKFSPDQLKEIDKKVDRELLELDLPKLDDTEQEPISEDNLDLIDEDLKGKGLTAEEIARSPEIGSWADDPEIPSGEEYVERIRRGFTRLS